MKNEPQKRSLMIVDDEPGNTELLARAFRQDFDVHVFGDPGQALSQVESLRPAVIIADQRMPQMSGVQFLERTLPHSPDSIRVLVTGFPDVETAVQSINRAGVFRFYSKPLEMEALHAAVASAVDERKLQDENRRLTDELARAHEMLLKHAADLEVEVGRRTHELEESNRQLRDLVGRDTLTGLWDLRTFMEALPRATEQADRSGDSVVVAISSVGGIIEFNELNGYLAGDQLLREIARLCMSEPYEGPGKVLIARYGGRRFDYLFSGTVPAQAKGYLERMRSKIAATVFLGAERIHPERINLSVGMSIYPSDASNHAELLMHASAAARAAEESGGNRVLVYEVDVVA